MRAAELVRDAFAPTVLTAIFAFLVFPFYWLTSGINLALFAAALYFIFASWPKKIFAFLLTVLATAFALAAPFIQFGRVTYIAPCSNRDASCFFVQHVDFYEEHGVLFPYTDPVRPWLINKLASHSASVVNLTPRRVQGQWFMTSRVEQFMFSLGNSDEAARLRLTVDLGPSHVENFTVEPVIPEDTSALVYVARLMRSDVVHESGSGSTATAASHARAEQQRFELMFDFSTGFTTNTNIGWSVPSGREHEGLFSVRSGAIPAWHHYRTAVRRDLVLRSLLAGRTTAENLADRAAQSSADTSLRLLSLALLARQHTGLVNLPHLQRATARFCRTLQQGEELPDLTAGQADLLREAITGSWEVHSAFRRSQPLVGMRRTVVSQCGVLVPDILRVQHIEGRSPPADFEEMLLAMAGVLDDASQRMRSASALNADSAQAIGHFFDNFFDESAQQNESENGPQWMAEARSAAAQGQGGRERMRRALDQPLLSPFHRAFVACSLLKSAASDRILDHVRRFLLEVDQLPKEDLAERYGVRADDLAGIAATTFLQRLTEEIWSDARSQEFVAECGYWRDEVPLSSLEALVLNAEFRPRAGASAVVSRFLGERVRFFAMFGEDAPTWRMVAAASGSPLLDAPLMAGFGQDDLLSEAQARTLLVEPRNFPVLVTMLKTIYSSPTAIRRANTDTILGTAGDLELDSQAAGAVYVLRLLSTERPSFNESARFAAELGGDPDWVCLVLASRGQRALCRPEGPLPTDRFVTE